MIEKIKNALKWFLLVCFVGIAVSAVGYVVGRFQYLFTVIGGLSSGFLGFGLVLYAIVWVLYKLKGGD